MNPYEYDRTNTEAWVARYQDRTFAIAGLFCHLMLMTRKEGTR